MGRVGSCDFVSGCEGREGSRGFNVSGCGVGRADEVGAPAWALGTAAGRGDPARNMCTAGDMIRAGAVATRELRLGEAGRGGATRGCGAKSPGPGDGAGPRLGTGVLLAHVTPLTTQGHRMRTVQYASPHHNK